ncbi:hypothetical protein BCT40_16405 [Vibrio lentus]|uniref:hypothetical protein n=1 Tax=Vibrio lentus TaxID=136468 RepID=UPI000C83BB86|nr:hypothetical protein [Vibrio lentus]MCC4858882.1 hypothetical protein [Vibrio lentus]PME59438.1 hypothetical protein BCV33_05340 [Vibrio lentus]PMG57290.1 hypothetical protein BCU87_02520 [Vibrio lentus]PMN05821.1 hypothetical protein BCT40_16405 [Vibrio lentus]TKF40753.1 hypothetical protein FCV64_20125 [Vibrio lentus]
MDSKEDIKYAFDFFNAIFTFMLLALIGCAILFWFQNFEITFAIANTGASLGVLLAALSARSAKELTDRALVVIGLLCTVGFQIWSMAAA